MTHATVNAAGSRESGGAENVSPSVGYWLFAVALMVAAIMLIGATTRLTGSGLSMVEWRPLMGALPPLSEAEWQRLFDLYRQTSQYRLQNVGMSLAEFREIFWWEYIHRLWGRLIGLAFLIPGVVLYLRGHIPQRLLPQLVGLFFLGALQGVIGWWMVTSGFADRVTVSQYRLAVHMGLAVLIFAWLLWLALDILLPAGASAASPTRRLAGIALAVAFVTILSGAFVAGTGAGLVHNQWPSMQGGFWPEDGAALSPWWHNLFENPSTIQFNHRILAYMTLGLAIGLAVAVLRDSAAASARVPAILAAAAAVAQAAVGITVLLLAVPVSLAVLHQGGAILFLSLLLWTNHRLAGRPARTIRRRPVARRP